MPPNKPPQVPPGQVQVVDEDNLRTLIERFTAWSEEPALTQGEVDDLCRLAHGQPAWQAETFYPAGYIVSDSAITGRFGVVLAGTSGTDEPDWTAEVVTDGSVQWVAAGEPEYDIYGAAGIGWDWKAAKIAGRYDLSRAGQSWQRSQAWQHCIRMAEYYRSLGSGRLAGGRVDGGGAEGSRVGRPGLITVAAPTTALPVVIGAPGDIGGDVRFEPLLEMADEL